MQSWDNSVTLFGYQNRHSGTLERLYFAIAETRSALREPARDEWQALQLEDFRHIRLQYEMDWPLNLVVTPEQMRSYGRIWNLFLQLRLVSPPITVFP